MSSHSPAPWTIVGTDGHALGIWDAEAKDVVSENGGPMRQEDARLIASAPLLLDALKELVRLENLAVQGQRSDEWVAAWNAARAAVAKARGES